MNHNHIVRQRAYAKINLTLEVLKSLPDGYHEVASVMKHVQLHDDIIIQHRVDGKIGVMCNVEEIPLDQRNLVWRAVEVVREQFGLNYGADVKIMKRIPVEGGLAGGSTDAAATLKGLNKLWNLRLSQDEMWQLGEKLGMDVPFCLLGGPALATGKGQIVTPLEPLPEHPVVIANPGKGVSTKLAYQKLDKILDWTEQRYRFTPLFVSALRNNRMDEIYEYFNNDFEKTIIKEIPIITLVKKIMLAYGARVALLSGSGPSVYCMTNSQEQAHTIARVLRSVVPFVCVSQTFNPN